MSLLPWTSLLFREWKRDILNFSEWPVATRATLSWKLGRAWLKPGLTHCEKTLWYPSCHSECEIQDMTCQDEPLQHIVAMQLSRRYISLQRKAFEPFPWWNEYKCRAPSHLNVIFFFFSNRMVCTKYADGWKWPQCLLSSLIAERFLEADLFSISLHLYLRGLGSVWKSDGFKIHVDVLLFLQWRLNC